LQASRPRFDVGWMLEAVMAENGNPPAIRAGHKLMRYG